MGLNCLNNIFSPKHKSVILSWFFLWIETNVAVEANPVTKIRALVEKPSAWADVALLWNHSPKNDDQITLHTQARGSITKRNGRRGSVHQAKIPTLLVCIWFMSTRAKIVTWVEKRTAELCFQPRHTAGVGERNS